MPPVPIPATGLASVFSPPFTDVPVGAGQTDYFIPQQSCAIE